MRCHVILVNPANPANIGFVARAMKTHGYGSLRIVGKEQDLFDSLAKKTAYASHDLLRNISFYPSLKEAIFDVDLTIATTSKDRTLRKELLLCKEVPDFLKDKEGIVEDYALVFGSEENGLLKNELMLCDVVTTIPMEVEYPSLNLAQSVLIYLYELNREKEISSNETDPDSGLFKSLKEESDDLLKWLELDRNPSFHQRIRDRIRMVKNIDSHLIMTIIKKLKHRFETQSKSE